LPKNYYHLDIKLAYFSYIIKEIEGKKLKVGFALERN
jgi:hypothetical protein